MKRVLFFVLFVFCFLKADDKIYLVPLYPDFEELEVVGYDYFPKIEEDKSVRDIKKSEKKVEEKKENIVKEEKQTTIDKKSLESPIKEVVIDNSSYSENLKVTQNTMQEVVKKEIVKNSYDLEEEILEASIKEFDEKLKNDEKSLSLLETLNMSESQTASPKINDFRVYNYEEILIEVSSKTNIMKVFAKEKRDTKLIKTFRVSTGKDNVKKPFGKGKISAISLKPTWYPTQSTKASFAKKGIILPNVVPYGNKYNYMGAAKINLTHIVDGQSTYRIHGTLNEKTIGTNESAGCIRMRNSEVLELANLLQDFANLKGFSKISVNLI